MWDPVYICYKFQIKRWKILLVGLVGWTAILCHAAPERRMLLKSGGFLAKFIEKNKRPWWPSGLIHHVSNSSGSRWVDDPGLNLTQDYDSCCVFWPAFGCCAHLKAGRNIFFSRFSTFFVHFRAFSVISRLKSTKNVWKCFYQLSGAHSTRKLFEIHNRSLEKL